MSDPLSSRATEAAKVADLLDSAVSALVRADRDLQGAQVRSEEALARYNELLGRLKGLAAESSSVAGGKP